MITGRLRWIVGCWLAVTACGTTDPEHAGRDATHREATAAAAALPQFERTLLLEPASETSANVSIGDVNGDGTLDVVLAKGRHWPLVDRVLLGDGRGHFPAAHDLGAAADRSYSARLVDLDGDADLDVVVGNDAPDAKVTYLNDGTGLFQPGSTYGRPEWETRNVSVADLDGDGRPDLIVANRGEHSANHICLNRGNGRFDADGIAFSREPATTITPADFDRDGRIDLAVPHRDGGQSYVYLNGGNAAFSDQRRVPFGPPDATIRMAETSDLDGDGALDIVTIDERRGVAVHFGREQGTFAPGIAIDDGDATPYALAVGDLNGDGKIDIVVGHVEAPSTVHFNDGTGRRFRAVRFGDGKGTVYGFAIADLDQDGLADIAAARSDAPNVVYFASSAAAHAPRQPVKTNSEPK